MRVYVNWDEQKVVGPEQADQLIHSKHEEMLADDAVFEDFLTESYTICQIWEMSNDERAEVLEEFNKLQLEEAEDWFDNEFCEYRVE